MKRSTLISIIVALAVIALIAIYFATNKSGGTATPSPSPSATPPTSTATSPLASSSPTAGATMEYTSSGFSPSKVTLTSGSKVTFKNTSSSTIQVDSDPHPQHTDNPELNAGTIAPGQSVSMTLTKTGTWGIHNHLDPSNKGTVVVQ